MQQHVDACRSIRWSKLKEAERWPLRRSAPTAGVLVRAFWPMSFLSLATRILYFFIHFSRTAHWKSIRLFQNVNHCVFITSLVVVTCGVIKDSVEK